MIMPCGAFIGLAICLPLTLALSQSDGALRFGADGTFKILQLADLHYGDSDTADEATAKVRLVLIEFCPPILHLQLKSRI